MSFADKLDRIKSMSEDDIRGRLALIEGKSVVPRVVLNDGRWTTLRVGFLLTDAQSASSSLIHITLAARPGLVVMLPKPTTRYVGRTYILAQTMPVSMCGTGVTYANGRLLIPKIACRLTLAQGSWPLVAIHHPT